MTETLAPCPLLTARHNRHVFGFVVDFPQRVRDIGLLRHKQDASCRANMGHKIGVVSQNKIKVAAVIGNEVVAPGNAN